MNASAIIFYAISAFLLGSGLLAVTSRKIFRSAIWLLFTLVGVAALYFWMDVNFIGAIQIIVYVGGIVVLIIFSIFLTQQSGKEMPKPMMKRTVFSILAALFGLGFSYNLISHYGFSTNSATPFNVSVSEIGTQMLSTTSHGFVLPFEVVSMLLLAAMVGCIVIAMKTPEQKQAAIRSIPVQPELPVNIEELINTTITKKETPEEV
ncbi:MAG TPA: NADH-quinone oxidoreductase subunit J [Flavisolibacter sp.]|nr:NADH-quinone oxidoreductase subunit J [Flavisolibacter sp.]